MSLRIGYILLVLCFVMLPGRASAVESVDSAATSVVTSVQPAVVATVAETVEPVTIALSDSMPMDTTRHSNTYWIHQLIQNGFHINAPGVEYPRFPRFALKVYNWGNRVFNTYDTTYVQSTGKNWKLFFKSLNWGNNYALIFNNHTRLSMMSDLNADVGGYICFMAVSLGYMFNANQFIGNHSNSRSGFNFNFTCARFSGDIMLTNVKGGVKILRFGDYRNGATLNIPFNDVTNNTFTAKVFYFFNHDQYSHAAAYCFSKYQLKSAGTWLAGISTATQEIRMDFSGLPKDMLGYLPQLDERYNFHYRDYYLLGGYAYNWVLKPRRWLLNGTIMPAVGYKHTYEDSTEGRRDMFAGSLSALASMVYNHRQLFVSAQLRLDLYLYITRNFTFLNSYEYLLATVGVRF